MYTHGYLYIVQLQKFANFYNYNACLISAATCGVLSSYISNSNHNHIVLFSLPTILLLTIWSNTYHVHTEKASKLKKQT
jgi:uncharacterized membrane protein YjjB (DUF3815 family)